MTAFPPLTETTSMLKVRSEGGIEWLTLANPPVNVLTRSLIEQLVEALRRCADEPTTRVVVLDAEGRHFCAGADLREQQAAWAQGQPGAADLGETLYAAMLDFPKPLLGVAKGAVAGAGLSMLACCDLALAAKGTRISLPEIDVGVLGGISHARAALGKALVHYLALTGTPVEADRSAHAGLFFDVVEPDVLDDTALAVARKIAAKSPEAARYTKKCMRAVERIDQLAGYAREQELAKELRSTGTTDVLVSKFLDR